MKKIVTLALLLMATASHAQTSTAKKDLVARILVLQQPAIEQTAQMLVERPALQLQQQAGVALQTRVAPEKREAVAKQVQQDLKQYVDEVGPSVRQQAVKLAPSTIGTLLEERFTEDELKQLIAIIESPLNRKYMQMGGEFQKALGEKLVSQTQTLVVPKVSALEQAIAKDLGLPPPPPAKAHQVVGIQRLLDGAHHAQCYGRFVLLQLVTLEAAYAVLGRDGAPELIDHVVHHGIDAFFLFLQERFRIATFGCLHVVVQVAVAQVAVIHQPYAWERFLQQFVCDANKFGDA
jgi:hypothetical protein